MTDKTPDWNRILHGPGIADTNVTCKGRECTNKVYEKAPVYGLCEAHLALVISEDFRLMGPDMYRNVSILSDAAADLRTMLFTVEGEDPEAAAGRMLQPDMREGFVEAMLKYVTMVDVISTDWQNAKKKQAVEMKRARRNRK